MSRPKHIIVDEIMSEYNRKKRWEARLARQEEDKKRKMEEKNEETRN